MNGFKVLAVGAFLSCGSSFGHAQINILDHQGGPKSILVKAVQDTFEPANEANLTRSRNADAEISASPSNTFIDGDEAPAPTSDPASLPVGIRHGHNPIDQIIRNGLIAQTPDSAQVPVAWPSQGSFNPTAHMMMNPGCTQGLWDSYPAERAAECALMHQRLAGHQRCQGCGVQGCGTQGCGPRGFTSGCKVCGPVGCGTSGCGAAHFQPVNRYAPAAVCDASHVTPASHRAAKGQPQFQNLLVPTPALAAPLVEETTSDVSVSQDNVAQRPSLIR